MADDTKTDPAGCLAGLAVITLIEFIILRVVNPFGVDYPPWTMWANIVIIVALFIAAAVAAAAKS